jgi:hypothetical protein
MNTIFPELDLLNADGADVFQPEELVTMKRVFDDICRDEVILPDDLETRQSLARSIFSANKSRPSESDLYQASWEGLQSNSSG